MSSVATGISSQESAHRYQATPSFHYFSPHLRTTFMSLRAGHWSLIAQCFQVELPSTAKGQRPDGEKDTGEFWGVNCLFCLTGSCLLRLHHSENVCTPFLCPDQGHSSLHTFLLVSVTYRAHLLPLGHSVLRTLPVSMMSLALHPASHWLQKAWFLPGRVNSSSTHTSCTSVQNSMNGVLPCVIPAVPPLSLHSTIA